MRWVLGQHKTLYNKCNVYAKVVEKVMNEEKELLKMMIINAYVFSGFWCFSLKKSGFRRLYGKTKGVI